jgi:type I restriction enzyme S subunit
MGGGLRQSLKFEHVKRLPVLVPSREEQVTIATAITRETTRIDALIEKKARFIELLKEKRQALITHAVTKGLDPSVKMKVSGVEWIGEVPEHWQVLPIKYLASIGNGSTPSKDNSEYWADGTFPWLTSGCVNLEVVNSAEQLVSEIALSECHLPIISPPAVLVGITGQGKTRGMASTLLIQATINQHIAYLKPTTNDISVEYLRKFLDAAYDWLRFNSEGVGSTKGAITCVQLANTKIPLPPLCEQETTLKAIQRQTTRIDLLTEKTQRSITLLKERRAAFITAAVTGQIDLRGE